MIAAKVANALALDWPRDRLELIVAVDGGAEPGADATAARARAAGADLVLELPRARQVPRAGRRRRRTRAASCSRSRTPTRCGSRDALAQLAAAFADPEVGYACGQVRFVNEAGTNQEGLYWRYEMWLRAQRVGARVGDRRQRRDLRRAAGGTTCAIDVLGHDLAFPFNIVKRGRRAVYVPRRARPRRWSRPSRASGRASGG